MANVPPHTAGIIPHACHASRYGRIIFHDFAGDPQHYSSHAAILEQVANPGCNIFIIVVDLCGPPDVGRTAVLFWLTFKSIATKVEAKVIIVGSHAVQLLTLRRDSDEELSQLYKDVSIVFLSEIPSTNCGIVGHIALDCRYTKSQSLHDLHQLVQGYFNKNPSSKRKVTPGAVIVQGRNIHLFYSTSCELHQRKRCMLPIRSSKFTLLGKGAGIAWFCVCPSE